MVDDTAVRASEITVKDVKTEPVIQSESKINADKYEKAPTEEINTDTKPTNQQDVQKL
mgnify:CR=1 FL=1